MKPIVQIPEPCSEDWNKMTPENQGRFCDKCCKVVVDFTQKTTTEIVDFLKGRSSEKICGRFRSQDVVAPAPLPAIAPNFRFSHRMRAFAAALYLVFGGFLFSSCATLGEPQEHLAGAVAYTPDTIPQTINSHLTGDTTLVVPPDTTEPFMQGEVVAPQTPVQCPTPNPTNRPKMGKVALVPTEPGPIETTTGAPEIAPEEITPQTEVHETMGLIIHKLPPEQTIHEPTFNSDSLPK